MNLLSVIIPFIIHLEVKGSTEESNETTHYKMQLRNAGCDEEGYLLYYSSICINSDYHHLRPPNSTSLTNVYVAFRYPPKITNIHEGLKTIKVKVHDAVLLWEDPRVIINANEMNKQRLINRIPFQTSENVSFLFFPNSWPYIIGNRDGDYKQWAPIQGLISVEKEIERKTKETEDSWGTQSFEILFPTPLNASIPPIT